MAQTVFKLCKDAIYRVIFRNRSQIFEQKRDLCSWSIWECLGEQENGKRERELAGPKETRRKILNVAPEEIGSVKLAALPAFHGDITGRFSCQRETFMLENVGESRRYHNCFWKP